MAKPRVSSLTAPQILLATSPWRLYSTVGGVVQWSCIDRSRTRYVGRHSPSRRDCVPSPSAGSGFSKSRPTSPAWPELLEEANPMQPALLGVFHLLSVPILASCLHSPLSWS